MRRASLAAVTCTVIMLVAPPARAYMCPVVIKQAEELIARAERGKTTPESEALLEDARKLVREARVNHENAKSKKDHDDAIRKARTAFGLAEEALKLQAP
jgi:ribosome-binding protein aMBF1 (putative translation factor)